MRILYLFLSLTLSIGINAQSGLLKGALLSPDGERLPFANVALFAQSDSALYKAGATDENGLFTIRDVKAGAYYFKAVYLGYQDLWLTDLSISGNESKDLGVLTLQTASVELSESTITASRVMVEVKPDRTIFNVEGTINSAGSDGLALLRKAPNVTVDNNDNITVLGRSGVLLYVDGKRLPLSGQDLTTYLQNLPAEQIDRIEIITNPGARYEAEGNAGIIDIRLKKDKNLGANGSVNMNYSQGERYRTNLSGTGNFRNRRVNVFGNANAGTGEGFMRMNFVSYLNNMEQYEINQHENAWQSGNYRVGADYFLGKHHTVGVLAGGGRFANNNESFNRITLAQIQTPDQIDSILVARNTTDGSRIQQTYNLNYRFDNTSGRTLNIDVDYGRYENDAKRYQPNLYYDATETEILTQIINRFDTPTDIDIYTFQVDYEDKLWGGKVGLGGKLSQVVSDNTFLVFNDAEGMITRDDSASNQFKYDESVYAGYINYARAFGKKWNFSAGIRAEQTDATGNLTAFLPQLQQPPVDLNYLSWFPNIGLSWQPAPKHAFNLNGGRRINRPDYNVLNPFNNKISQLSYEKGNPFLRPEIVNNLELGYTLAYRYNFKVAYSRTTDQITRLIAPDDSDPRAGFITWDNLASQTIFSLNISAPVQILPKWNAYFNAAAAHQDNQANYGEGAIVDVQAFSYTIFQQHTFNLPWNLNMELSGYYSGPGIWGGVFLYEPSWSIDLGFQRKFLQDKLNVRISANDLFYETGWDGYSDFNGLLSYGSGRWDSRRVGVSIGYLFGNQNVKSRGRKAGLEAEANRVGGGG